MIIFCFNPLPGTSLYDHCVSKGLINNQSQMERNDFTISSISDQDWNPEILQKIKQREYWRFTFRLMIRRPIKFFRKYVLWRLIRRDRIKTLYNWSVDMVRVLTK
jgi:hypothetical protein